MAASISNHLGLHLDPSGLKISDLEKRLRERLFWCCFAVDRSRFPILGVGPYLDASDVTTKLAVSSYNDTCLMLRELCTLLDIAVIANRSIYSLQNQVELKGENRKRQIFALRDAEVKLLSWQVQLPQICRLRNDDESHPNTLLLYQLHVLYHAAMLLVQKPFTGHHVEKGIDPPMLASAISVIKLCSKVDFTSGALSFFTIYALYISTLCCMFYLYDTERRVTVYPLIKNGINLIQELSRTFPVARVYYERIQVVKEDWKVSIHLETREPAKEELVLPEFEDVDFGCFLWPPELSMKDLDFWGAA